MVWWWIKPLFNTGLVCVVLAALWAFTFRESEKKWPVYVLVTLLLPLIISFIATVLCILVNVFISIWSPYL